MRNAEHFIRDKCPHASHLSINIQRKLNYMLLGKADL